MVFEGLKRFFGGKKEKPKPSPEQVAARKSAFTAAAREHFAQSDEEGLAPGELRAVTAEDLGEDPNEGYPQEQNPHDAYFSPKGVQKLDHQEEPVGETMAESLEKKHARIDWPAMSAADLRTAHEKEQARRAELEAAAAEKEQADAEFLAKVQSVIDGEVRIKLERNILGKKKGITAEHLGITAEKVLAAVDDPTALEHMIEDALRVAQGQFKGRGAQLDLHDANTAIQDIKRVMEGVVRNKDKKPRVARTDQHVGEFKAVKRG